MGGTEKTYRRISIRLQGMLAVGLANAQRDADDPTRLRRLKTVPSVEKLNKDGHSFGQNNDPLLDGCRFKSNNSDDRDWAAGASPCSLVTTCRNDCAAPSSQARFLSRTTS
jgi:hypothetical protein